MHPNNVIVGIIIISLLSLTSIASAGEWNIKMHVYNDNSVTIEGKYVESSTGGYDAYMKITGDLYVKDNGFEIIINGNGTTWMVGLPLQDFVAKIQLNLEQKKENGIIHDEGTLYFYIRNEAGSIEINADPLSIKTNIDDLKTSIEGKTSISATGELEKGLNYFAMLDKDTAEQYLKTHNITGIKIIELDTNLVDNRVDIKYKIEIDLVNISKKTLSQEDISNIKMALAKFSYPFTLKLDYNTEHDVTTYTLRLRVDKNINKVLQDLLVLETIIKEYYSIEAYQELIPLPVARSNIMNQNEEEIDLLEEFVKTFEILPSTGKFEAEYRKTYASLEFITPKIVRKEAKTPKDTLLALYSFTKDLYKVVEQSRTVGKVDITPLLNTPVTLVPEHGVKVSATKINFSDIPAVQVVVTAPPTTSAPHTHSPSENAKELVNTTLILGLVAMAAVIGLTALLLARKKSPEI